MSWNYILCFELPARFLKNKLKFNLFGYVLELICLILNVFYYCSIDI